MSAQVFFYGSDQQAIRSGKTVFLGVLVYEVESDTLAVIYTNETPAPEVQAILTRFLRPAGPIKSEQNPSL